MRTTLDLPEDLIREGLRLTKYKTKTKLVTEAIEHLIRKCKLAQIKNYQGKLTLDVDLGILRGR